MDIDYTYIDHMTIGGVTLLDLFVQPCHSQLYPYSVLKKGIL